MSDAREMTKAERLALAAAEAPLLRNASEKTLSRRIHVTKNGEVVRFGSGRELLRGLAKIDELEHVVEEGVRPKTVVCESCGRSIAVPEAGRIIKTCRDGCRRTCAGFGATTGVCQKVSPAGSFNHRIVARRRGEPWRCLSCTAARRSSDPLFRAEKSKIARTMMARRVRVESFSTCHPSRRHYGKGLCKSCHETARRRRRRGVGKGVGNDSSK